MANDHIIVCASIANMEESVLLNKIREIFDKNLIKFSFWGWNRNKLREQKDYSVKHLWKGGGFSNKLLILHYPFWLIMVFFNALTLPRKSLILAVSLDVALPIYLVSIFKNIKYVFYNPDNFSLTYNLNGLTKKIIEFLEKKVAHKAVYHIIPESSRFSGNQDNILIYPNFPLESEITKAKLLFQDGKIDGINLNHLKTEHRLKIYINGRITFHRGSEWIADVLEELDPNKYLIIIAGYIYCDKLKTTLKGLPNVISFSRLVNYKALSLYYYADLVFAFYDPILPINRKAAPNKWWDCVSCKIPFVSNLGIETLQPFIDKNACFYIPYNDKTALLDLLDSINNDRKQLRVISERLSYFKVSSFDKNIDRLLTYIRKYYHNEQ